MSARTAWLAGALGANLLTAAGSGQVESHWITTGGDFDDPASWSGPVPDETVTAIFDLDEDPGPFVFFNADEVSGRAVIRAGAVDFQLWSSGPEQAVSRTYELMDTSFVTPSIVVGESGPQDASLRIAFGYLSARSLVLGLGAGSAGAVDFGVGLFDLAAGLACEYELHVGGAGQGLLTIDTGVVVTAGEAVLGAAGGGLGDVVVTNPGSALEVAGPLTVGRQGQGALSIDDLADVTSAAAVIGQQPGSLGVVTVSGQGATWDIDGALDVGLQGTGSLAVTGGAAVFTGGFAAIGSLPEPHPDPITGGTGDVTISGPASLWLIEGDLYVGLLWLGTLDVLDGATVTSQAGFVGLAAEPGCVATVDGVGSVWSTIGEVRVYGGSQLRVTGGASVLAPVVEVLAGAELVADGSILGALGGADGTVRVGDPLGTLHVDGAFGPAGALLLDLAGPGPGEFDTVSVSGDASLDAGTLEVSLVDGYTPEPGHSFEVLAAAAIVGTFEQVTLPPLPELLTWFVDRQPGSLTLRVTSLGDLDGDGAVDTTDLLILLAAWGPCPDPPDPCAADLTLDGAVDTPDFLLLLSQWG